MAGEAASRARVAERQGRAIVELKALQRPLLSGEVDPHVLRDFRDALNRVRNTAWWRSNPLWRPCWGRDRPGWRPFWQPSEFGLPINFAGRFGKMCAARTSSIRRAIWQNSMPWLRAWWMNWRNGSEGAQSANRVFRLTDRCQPPHDFGNLGATSPPRRIEEIVPTSLWQGCVRAVSGDLCARSIRNFGCCCSW